MLLCGNEFRMEVYSFCFKFHDMVPRKFYILKVSFTPIKICIFKQFLCLKLVFEVSLLAMFEIRIEFIYLEDNLWRDRVLAPNVLADNVMILVHVVLVSITAFNSLSILQELHVLI